MRIDDCRNMKSVFNSSIRTLYITSCPELEELPDLSKMSSLEELVISLCEKIQSIRLPTTLTGLCLRSCRDLRTVAAIGDCTGLRELTVRECPELEELPDLSRMSCLVKIEISQCEKLQNIRLPTTLTSLCLQSCRDSRTVVGIGDCMGLRELTVRECPELEELPDLSRMSCLEELAISQCEKIQNIRLPTTLTSLCLQSCRDLRTVVGIGDCTGLRELTVREWPELEELPDLSRMSSLEKLAISQCEKIQSIKLPTTLISLSLQSCRDLRTVVGIGDCVGLGKLTVGECPELEELPDLSRMSSLEALDISQCEKIQSIRLPTTLISLCLRSCRDLRTVAVTGVAELWSIVTDSCEKLQNIEGKEELQPVRYMKLFYCTNALIQNSVHKFKSLPDKINMIGRAVDGAESTLNANLFHNANVDVDSVGDIGRHKIYPMLSEFEAAYVCFVVAVDSCSAARDINGSLDTFRRTHGAVKYKVREGEWVFTLAGCGWMFWMTDPLLDIFRQQGILKKGIWAGLKKDQMGKSMQVLFTIVDRLYHL